MATCFRQQHDGAECAPPQGPWRLIMATQPLTPRGLKWQLDKNANETVVHCNGRITAKNSEM
jgi:hypothetical protein